MEFIGSREEKSGMWPTEKVAMGDGNAKRAAGIREWKNSKNCQCKEFLRPFKKCLRKLNLPSDLPKERRLNSTRKNLIILGDHIDMFLQHYCKTWELKHWKKMLWRFVSLFSAFDEKQLRKLYKYSKANEMSKFLKAYYCLNSPDLVTLPENGNLMKLRDTWGLCGDVMMQEKLAQMHPRSPSSSQSAGRVTKK
ncbi:hypothetical protein lerEdw1_008802 [Lerista edwardsae]|nr:hypothetical protein lerEdw1_008802 [Lerista edwardsae]